MSVSLVHLGFWANATREVGISTDRCEMALRPGSEVVIGEGPCPVIVIIGIVHIAVTQPVSGAGME